MSINVLESISLEKVGLFANLDFKIEPGLTTIYGLNRASGPASKNTNGVGKSFLGSIPHEIIYEEPIVGEKADRVRQGKRVMKFSNYAGHKIVIKREARGKTEKLEIEVDGENKQFRTPTIARQFLKKVWPISQEEYNTYVHIDSVVPHPLVRGTTSERKDFFTSFFGLDKIDAERKLYRAELSDLAKTRAAFNELRVQYQQIKADLMDEETAAASEEKAAKLRRLLTKYQKEFTSVQEVIRLIEFEAAAAEQIATLKQSVLDISIETFSEAVESNRWESKKIEADLEEAERWEQYKRDNKHYTEAYNGLSDAAKGLIQSRRLLRAREDASAAASTHSTLKERFERQEAEIEREEKELRALERVAAVAQPEGDFDEARTLERVYAKHLEHAERFEDGKCETCGQTVQIKDPKVVEKKLTRVRQLIADHEAYASYASARKEAKALKFKIRAHQRDLEALRKRLADALPLAKVHRELKDLPRKPKAFEGKKLQVTVLKRMLEELRERRSLLRYLAPHLDTLVALQTLTAEDRERAKAATGLADKMNDVQERLSKLVAKIEVNKSQSGQARKMRLRLKEMKAELADEEALKALVQAYDDRNIKKMVVEAISQKLFAIINRIAKKVFPEDYEFSFEWDSQIHILVHRRYGQEVKTSDVRKLSGAESTIFTLILVCALLAFVPERKRSSIMILDEPSARLSAEMIEVLKEVINVLVTMIPSIVIITPKDEIYEGSKPYTVVKDKHGVAKLFAGYPHEYKH